MQFLKTFISNNKVVLRNILLGFYYLLAHYMLKKYQVDDHLELPYVVACWILFLLVAEPFSIRTITAHEAFKSEKKQPGLPIGIISGSFIAVARIVFRLLFLLAALPAIFPSYYFDHPATIYIIAILFFSELLTLFALSKPRIKAATPVVENVHQFILWNISCIFLFIFDESLMRHIFFSDAGQGNSVGMLVLFSVFLFLIFYLPNRIIEIYAEWVDLRGFGAKSKYLLSIIWLYVLMLATN